METRAIRQATGTIIITTTTGRITITTMMPAAGTMGAAIAAAVAGITERRCCATSAQPTDKTGFVPGRILCY